MHNTEINQLDNWIKFNDIRIRKILNIEGLYCQSIELLYQLKGYSHINPLANFTYFYQINNTICTGFTISTIDGKICIPVIGMKHITAKIEIKNSLINYLPQFKQKHHRNKELLLLYYTDLPIEIIKYIMSFY